MLIFAYQNVPKFLDLTENQLPIMNNPVVYYLIIINVITFIVYGIDKLKARKGWWRISEATLLLLAAIGGSIGAWGGMMLWRHKTKHLKFKIGVPAILLTQIALAIYLIRWVL